MLSLILGAGMALQSADTIFVNGRVYVQKGRFETALAVLGDKVLAVGSDATVKALAGKTTRIIDLKGRLVTPGFNDAHVHFIDDIDERKGTLEPGKLADLGLFAADLFKLEPRKILTTPVDLTMVGGRVVFERTSAHTP